MKITKVICPVSKYSIKCPYEMTPEYITVHNTANDASAMSEISYMLGNNNEVSYHLAVDDYRAVQGIEFNRNTWNAGDGGKGKGNRKSISIEICYSKSGGERFAKAEQNAAELIAYLLKQYGWGIDRVKRHYDWSRKDCPHRTIDLGWERFLNMVREKMGQAAKPVTPDKPATSNKKVNVFYKVRTQKHGWLGEIKNYNLTDSNGYAGWGNSPITGVAIKVDKGSIKYRVHVKGGSRDSKGNITKPRWLGWITKYDTKDAMHGYAGNGELIDAIQIYYYTPNDIRPYKKAKYQVNTYKWQSDTDDDNGQDGYAGVMGTNVTKLRVSIE